MTLEPVIPAELLASTTRLRISLSTGGACFCRNRIMTDATKYYKRETACPQFCFTLDAS